MYCITCGRAIYSVEELRDHLKDMVTLRSFSDDVAWEEAQAAD